MPDFGSSEATCHCLSWHAEESSAARARRGGGGAGTGADGRAGEVRPIGGAGLQDAHRRRGQRALAQPPQKIVSAPALGWAAVSRPRGRGLALDLWVSLSHATPLSFCQGHVCTAAADRVSDVPRRIGTSSRTTTRWTRSFCRRVTRHVDSVATQPACTRVPRGPSPGVSSERPSFLPHAGEAMMDNGETQELQCTCDKMKCNCMKKCECSVPAA